MGTYTKEELLEALQVVSSTISNCEKIHPKFDNGTSQHTLLKNRIKALYISKYLIIGENIKGKYTKEELVDSLRHIDSIISKSEKAQLKFVEGNSHYTRLKKIIDAMTIALLYIQDAIK